MVVGSIPTAGAIFKHYFNGLDRIDYQASPSDFYRGNIWGNSSTRILAVFFFAAILLQAAQTSLWGGLVEEDSLSDTRSASRIEIVSMANGDELRSRPRLTTEF